MTDDSDPHGLLLEFDEPSTLEAGQLIAEGTLRLRLAPSTAR